MPVPGSRTQRGIALLTSLLILVVVTLIAVSMYKNFGLQEKLAGNTLEKQRSLLAADSAVRFGEWWLSQGNTGSGVVCNGGEIDANVQANMKICSNGLATPGTVPWANRFKYKPPTMTILAGGGLNTASTGTIGDVNYATSPSLYVSYMGLGPNGKSMLYQVTGVGYGGSTTTVSVLQSVYAMTYAINDLSGP